MRCFGWLVSVLFVCGVTAGDDAATEWLRKPAARERIPAYQPALRLEARRYETPRPLRVWIAEVDLRHPEVAFVLTEPKTFEGEDAKFETGSSTTLGFAEEHNVALAINTSAFGPFRARAGLPMDVVGLAAVGGQTYSTPHAPYGSMLIDRENKVELQEPPFPEKPWHAVPGFRMLLDDAKVVVDPERAASSFGGLNPRTAVGTDRTGQRLWIVVADGRQPDVSTGITLVELGALFKQLGAWDALNLDGGGSTTMVIRDRDGAARVLNTPVGMRTPGSLRLVANNMGLRLPGKGPTEEALSGGDAQE